MNIPLGILEIDRILGGGPAAPVIWDGIVLGIRRRRAARARFSISPASRESRRHD
jgi:hypothetical protein